MTTGNQARRTSGREAMQRNLAAAAAVVAEALLYASGGPPWGSRRTTGGSARARRRGPGNVHDQLDPRMARAGGTPSSPSSSPPIDITGTIGPTCYRAILRGTRPDTYKAHQGGM